jgi:hypothetical protein
MNKESEFAVITVTAELQGSYYFVSSPELPGLALMGKNHTELFDKLPYLIKELYKDNYGMDVQVVKASEPEENKWTWAIAA